MHDKRIVSSSEIGKRIKCRRRELSLTQEELATLLDVSYQQIQRYESGKDRLNVEKLQSIANALTVPVSYFVCHGGNEGAYPGDDQEKELISHYRKIQRSDIKALMVNFATLVATWEKDWNGT